MDKATIIRYILTAIMTVFLFLTAHWFVAIIITLILINNEMTILLIKKLGKNDRQLMAQIDDLNVVVLQHIRDYREVHR